LCVLGLHLMDHGLYVQAKVNGEADWLADARDVEHVLATLDQQPPGAVASTNPGLVYLRTHRKGVALAYAEQNWHFWSAAGVRYLVSLRPLELPASARDSQMLLKTKRHRWIVKM
jgi:hypothetical protein